VTKLLFFGVYEFLFYSLTFYFEKQKSDLENKQTKKHNIVQTKTTSIIKKRKKKKQGNNETKPKHVFLINGFNISQQQTHTCGYIYFRHKYIGGINKLNEDINQYVTIKVQLL